MPGKMKRPCNKIGCTALTTERYCEEHKQDVVRKYDKERGSAAQRGYDGRWRRVSKLFLAAHPLCECEDCKKLNRLLPSNVVDHIIPHQGNYKLFWDESNWQAMNKHCHDRKTARENGGFGNRGRGG